MRLVPPKIIKPFSKGFLKMIKEICVAVNRIDGIAEDLERLRQLVPGASGGGRDFRTGNLGIFVISEKVGESTGGPIGSFVMYRGRWHPMLTFEGENTTESFDAICADYGVAGQHMPQSNIQPEPSPYKQDFGPDVCFLALMLDFVENGESHTCAVRQTVWGVNCG